MTRSAGQILKQCYAVAKEKAEEIAQSLDIKADVNKPTDYDYPLLGQFQDDSDWYATGAKVKAGAWFIYFVFQWDYTDPKQPYWVHVWI